MNKKILAGISFIIVLGLVLAGCGGKGKAGAAVSVPVNLNGANGLGSLQIELTYDAAILQATAVKAGELAKNAMIEFNVKTPGLVKVGIVDASGIKGDGIIMTVSFNSAGNQGTSPITINRIEAYDAASLVDIPAKASAGSVTVKNGSVTALVINLAP